MKDSKFNFSPQLVFLGTGSAFPQSSFNTCFVLRDKGLLLLVDAGGGNGIVNSLRNNEIDIESIENLFVTHTHTDHILGAIWIVRSVINSFINGNTNRILNIYGNADVLGAIDRICWLTLLPEHYKIMQIVVQLRMIETKSDDYKDISGYRFRFFNVMSENVNQTGFEVALSNGSHFVFLGDEAITPHNMKECINADWLVCGAFCCECDAEVFRPFEKHHHTVKEVSELSERCSIRNLVIVHSEDSDLKHKKEKYVGEASKYFKGKVYVPQDSEKIILY